MFQLAKKGMSFDLPTYFPNIQPVWETVIVVQKRLTKFTMGVLDNELYYFYEKPTSRHREIAERHPMLKIPQKELDLIGYKMPTPEVREEIASQPEPVQKAAEVQAIIERERASSNVFDDHMSYVKTNEHYSKLAEIEAWAQKEARAAKNAEAALEKAATKKAKEPMTVKGFLNKIKKRAGKP